MKDKSTATPRTGYSREMYLQAAERVRHLMSWQHHSCLDTERLAAALEKASEQPTEPKNVELMDSLPLVVYVAVV